MKCWLGKLEGRNTLIVSQSKEHAAALLGIAPKDLDGWSKKVPPGWATANKVYVQSYDGWFEERSRDE